MGVPMSEPESRRPTDAIAAYPRKIECRKCRQPVDAAGWCAECARRRTGWTAIALGLGGPIFGMGACLVSPTNVASLIGTSTCCGLPLIAIVFESVRRRSIEERERGGGRPL